MRERTIELNGVALSTAESTEGDRPILLVHGFAGAKEDFSSWLDRLGREGWHAVAPDLRGHGSSDKPASENEYSLEIFAGDLMDLADALGWERFVLLGHSMGGMVAQLVAVLAHDRLDGLVLMDTCHGPVEIDMQLVDVAVEIVRTRGIDALADALAGRPSPLDTQAHRRLLETKPGYAEFCDRKLRATSPALYAAIAPSLGTVRDRLADLEQLPASLQVMVMVGEQDAPFLGPSKRMSEVLTGGSPTEIPEAGHSPQFENPDAWWEALSSFLASLPAAR